MAAKKQNILHNTKKNAKKKAKFLLRHPLLVPVTSFFVVVFLGMGLFVAFGASTEGASDSKIVDLYVDGKHQTISTRAKTVDDLMTRLDIELIDEDIVEPARDYIIFEDNTQINVYRARPVSVTDKDRTITVLSAQQAPRLIAAEAGIKLYPEDEVIAVHADDEGVLASISSEQLVIDRSVEVQLNVYGAIRKFRSTADTVADLLSENNITIHENENIQPENIETPITSGMLVSVNRPGIKTLAITETINFEIETKSDPNLTIGESGIEREGVNGEKAVIYEILEENGVEVSRTEIQTIVTLDPVSEIRLSGTKPATLSSSVNVSEDKVALMAAAGISPSDYPYVDFIISHESGWRPGAANSSSGAYGLCQSLPASKMASAGADYLTNPVTQLKWCSSYSARYGGWQGAYNAWLVQRWW